MKCDHSFWYEDQGYPCASNHDGTGVRHFYSNGEFFVFWSDGSIVDFVEQDEGEDLSYGLWQINERKGER